MAKPVHPWLFWLFASFMGIAAAYHFVGIFGNVNDDPAWRHALFAGIDLGLAYGLLKRPRHFSWFFLAFLIQQYYTHGAKFINRWEVQATVDWISLLVLLVLPVVFFFLRKEEKARRAASPLPARQTLEKGKL
jgi:hypothetical protein